MDLPKFYDEHVDKVYKFFYIKSLDKHIAEDLTHDTFVAFMDKQDKFSAVSAKQYLYGIMRNTWINFLKMKYQSFLYFNNQ